MLTIFAKNFNATVNRLDIDNFETFFKDKDVFETADIAGFYHSTNKPAIINWRIYSLVQKGVLQRVGRGKFCLGKSKTYMPEVLPKLKSVYKKISKEFPFANICVWHSSVFNEFMQHQAGKFYYLVEVEKGAAEAVFHALKERNFAAFLTPNQEILNRYIPENKDVFIVKTLVSEAPTQKNDGICMVTLEKMLVDIFCDETLFAAQQGAEMRTIFNAALSKYTVNRNKMLRYANRRKKKECFENYLKTITKYRQQTQISAIL